MRYSGLRVQLRQARRRADLTQAALAERSGVSRVTIARLEAGSAGDVRAGTIASLCATLGLELTAMPAGAVAALETRLAREQDRVRRLDLQRRHAALAARLLALPRGEAGAHVSRARAVVERWEREGLCSGHYISRWKAMLTAPIGQVAKSLIEPGEWRDALFQNTPWGFALGAPER
jgi:transcriptional regulator with XRE-family HTH domain